MEVKVEVLDVTDDEARKLLLSIDPLAQFADYDNSMLDELRETFSTDNESLAALWAGLKKSEQEVLYALRAALTRSMKAKSAAWGAPGKPSNLPCW